MDFSPEDVEKIRYLAKTAAENNRKNPDQVTADEIIQAAEGKAQEAYKRDRTFYRHALYIIGGLVFATVIALVISVVIGKGGTEGLVAVASGGIGALAGLFVSGST